MYRTFVVFLALFCGLLLMSNSISMGQTVSKDVSDKESNPKTESAGSPDQGSAGRLDYLAIQDSIAGYLAAINDRDAAAAAQYWSENGQWVAEDGTRVSGLDSIERSLADSFNEDGPGQQVALKELTIRLLSDDVAVEEGTAIVSSNNREPTESTYIVTHVKRNGAWKIDSIRETVAPQSPNRRSQLDKLSWLVGNWKDQDADDISINANCDWTHGNHSLRRSFNVTQGDALLFSGTQVIMWDARLGQIRSWIFDSGGGFGNGIWTQTANNQWTVDAEFQSADGSVGTSKNTYTLNNDGNQFNFQSTDRMLDGVALPDLPEVTVNRIK